ncbi:MAG: hypothetical protein R8L53_02425 [Mariprofundales bacterium]
MRIFSTLAMLIIILPTLAYANQTPIHRQSNIELIHTAEKILDDASVQFLADLRGVAKEFRQYKMKDTKTQRLLANDNQNKKNNARIKCGKKLGTGASTFSSFRELWFSMEKSASGTCCMAKYINISA